MSEIFLDVLPIITTLLNITYFIYCKFNIKLMLFFIFTLGLHVYGSRSLKLQTISTAENYNISRNKLVLFNQDLNVNLHSILTFNNIQYEKKKIMNEVRKYSNDHRLNLNTRFKFLGFNLIVSLIYFIISIYWIKGKYSKNIIISYILAYLSYNIFLIGRIREVSLIFTFLGKTRNGLINFNNFFNKMESNKRNEVDIKNIKKNNFLCIRDLKFSYDANNVFKIKKIEFELKKINILKGSIGSGKSTLLKILFGLYNADEGAISYKDFNINDKSEWRMNFHYCQQFPQVFNQSVKYNLCYPNGEFQSNMEDVLNETKLNTTITSLLDKNYKVGLGGEKLSGGEKQIINLFRFLLYPKDIILLDEPTSSLDTEHRKIIYQIIKCLKEKGHTLIIATHDLEIIKMADNIYDFNELNIN